MHRDHRPDGDGRVRLLLVGSGIDSGRGVAHQGDAMRLAPIADRGARLVDLVDALQAALADGAPVLLVGAPAVHVPKGVQLLDPIALRLAARLDGVAQRLAEIRSAVRFVPGRP